MLVLIRGGPVFSSRLSGAPTLSPSLGILVGLGELPTENETLIAAGPLVSLVELGLHLEGPVPDLIRRMHLAVELDVQPDEPPGFPDDFVRAFDRTTKLFEVLADHDPAINFDRANPISPRIRARRLAINLLAVLNEVLEFGCRP